MADYYPLIARAISGLDENASGETRRALYERARTALIAQLRNVQPPLSEAEITRERLALEEAVGRVEADAAKRAKPEPQRPLSARPETRPDAARPDQARTNPPRFEAPQRPRSETPPPPPPPRPRAGDAFRASARPLTDREGAPLAPSAPPRPTRNLRADAPPPRDPSRDVTPRENSYRDAPPRDLRAPRNDTQMLDEWTKNARAAPRADARGVPVRRPPDDRQRPDERQRPGVSGLRDVVADAEELGRTTARRPNAPTSRFDRDIRPDDNFDAQDADPYSYDESVEEAERYQQGRVQGGRISLGASEEPDVRVKRPFPVKSAIGVVAAIVLIAGGYAFYKKVYPSIRAALAPSPAVEAPKDSANTRPKITDRVGQSGDQVAPVAQRVVLYDEDPTAAQGRQYVGTVVWRTEQVKAAAGQRADIGVRADIEIPERKMKMTLTVRRNTDASLPASHTAELTFTLPPDFGATVSSVPGVLMKSNEQARGTPLAGLAVKVTDGFFLVGLSNVEADKGRNLQLLKERSWFDIPIVYSNQRRSIIAIEKGAPGERAFNEAFLAWGQ